jgi:hypothetical protein
MATPAVTWRVLLSGFLVSDCSVGKYTLQVGKKRCQVGKYEGQVGKIMVQVGFEIFRSLNEG